MASRKVAHAVRMKQHGEMMAAFVAFLDGHWPLWRRHVGETRYNDLLAAFRAGWTTV